MPDQRHKKDPWAQALAQAIDRWYRQYGHRYGLRVKGELGNLLNIPTWGGISAGSTVTKTEYYAALYLLTELPEADPRTVPPKVHFAPRTSERSNFPRAWSEEVWEKWVTSAAAEEIQKLKIWGPSSLTAPTSVPQDADQQVVPPVSEGHDDVPRELPHLELKDLPVSAGRLLDMLLTTAGNQLVASAATAGRQLGESIAQTTAHQVDAVIQRRFEERDRSVETSISLISRFLPQLQSFVQDAAQLEEAVPMQQPAPTVTPSASENLADEVADKVISWLQGVLGDQKPKRRAVSKTTDQMSIGQLAQALAHQLQAFVSTEATPATRDELQDTFGAELIELLSLVETLTLKPNEREEVILTKRMGGATL